MKKKLLLNFLTNIRIITETYELLCYGQKRRVVFINRILKKLRSKRAKKFLKNEDIKEINEEFNLLDKKSKKVTIKLTQKDCVFLRTLLQKNLKIQKGVIIHGREQAIISLCCYFEAFISEIIKKSFFKEKRLLKNNSNTLKDSDIIKAYLEKEDIIEKLINLKLNKIMYSGYDDWILFLKKEIGINVKSNKQIKELFLIRNCLIHNNRKTDIKLNKLNKKYKLNSQIITTDILFKQFFFQITAHSQKIFGLYFIKFK